MRLHVEQEDGHQSGCGERANEAGHHNQRVSDRGDGYPGGTADRREAEAFGEQLADQP